MHFLKMTTGSLLIIMGIGWGGKKYLFLYSTLYQKSLFCPKNQEL